MSSEEGAAFAARPRKRVVEGSNEEISKRPLGNVVSVKPSNIYREDLKETETASLSPLEAWRNSLTDAEIKLSLGRLDTILKSGRHV